MPRGGARGPDRRLRRVQRYGPHRHPEAPRLSRPRGRAPRRARGLRAAGPARRLSPRLQQQLRPRHETHGRGGSRPPAHLRPPPLRGHAARGPLRRVPRAGGRDAGPAARVRPALRRAAARDGPGTALPGAGGREGGPGGR